MQFRIRNDAIRDKLKLNELRLRRFQRLMRHLNKSPYYREIANRKSLLTDFPVINKKVFMANFDLINTVGIKKIDALRIALDAESSRDFSSTLDGITIGLSTGTSGNKGVFLVSEKERAKWVAAMLHRVVGFRLKKRKIAFFLRANSKLYQSANSRLLTFNFFDLLTPHEENFRRLLRINADILIAQPSALLRIAASYAERGIKPGFSKVISVAEVLEKVDRAYLESVFGIHLDEVYQCTEGFLACSCKEGNLHFNEDYLIIEKEYLDENRNRYYPIITDLYRETQPIIRYKLDDILIEGESCKCGSNYSVIRQIEGRADDVVRLLNSDGDPVDIYPDFLTRAITSASDHISYYELIQKDHNILEVYFEHEGDDTRIKERVYEQLQSLLTKFSVVNIEIRFIGKPVMKETAKLRRIRNEYSETP